MESTDAINSVMREKLEAAANQYGFRDLDEYYRMREEVNFFVPGVKRKFLEWSRHNGTKSGLNLILIHAEKCPACFHGRHMDSLEILSLYRCTKCGALFGEYGDEREDFLTGPGLPTQPDHTEE